eukprot:TRINITY_DN3846_c0_g1_i1.p1 TRINITY_DN3846_c0_g1~~TRINITY_DN3846_c0_g1_i1.p1  ORF type:complete len:371 (-),score=87.13 TRINITY_DN3846_c0_g1_i1:179-1264(-)
MNSFIPPNYHIDQFLLGNSDKIKTENNPDENEELQITIGYPLLVKLIQDYGKSIYSKIGKHYHETIEAAVSKEKMSLSSRFAKEFQANMSALDIKLNEMKALMNDMEKEKEEVEKERDVFMNQLEEQEDVNQKVEKSRDDLESKLIVQQNFNVKLRKEKEDAFIQLKASEKEIERLKKFIDDESLKEKNEALLEHNMELEEMKIYLTRTNSKLEAQIAEKPIANMKRFLLSEFSGRDRDLVKLDKDINWVLQRQSAIQKEVTCLESQMFSKTGSKVDDIHVQRNSSINVKAKRKIGSYMEWVDITKNLAAAAKYEIVSIKEKLDSLKSEQKYCSSDITSLRSKYKSLQADVVRQFVTDLFF